ncbi:MAG TPA: hypothetical protein VFY56_11210 [Propionibacteriaceae bacterium]|nr:hypothetical protein [Propionibacteriaceae bacterium]
MGAPATCARQPDVAGPFCSRTVVQSCRRLTEALQVQLLGKGQLEEEFDTVLDSGLFHVFDDDDRVRYVAALAAAITPRGRYYMLCFSERQPGTLGPRRVSQQEIKAAFAPPGWRIDAIDAVTMDTNMDQVGVHAWRASITRNE